MEGVDGGDNDRRELFGGIRYVLETGREGLGWNGSF